MTRRCFVPLAVAVLAPLLLVAGCGGSDADDTVDTAQAAACSAGRACVSTIAGTGEQGDADGTAATAQLYFPHTVAVDAAGNLQVGDLGGHSRLRLIGTDGRVSTSENETMAFPFPSDVAVDGRGNRYVADRYNNRILRIAPDGSTTTLAGRDASAGGDVDGDASTARFRVPMGIALGPDGNLYVADTGNSKIRKITLPHG